MNENITNIMLDFVDSDNTDDAYYVLSDFKSVRTDSTGVANFETLSVMDVRDYSCISYRFLVGQPDSTDTLSR